MGTQISGVKGDITADHHAKGVRTSVTDDLVNGDMYVDSAQGKLYCYHNGWGWLNPTYE